MEKKEVEINDSSVCLVPGLSVCLSVSLCVCGGCTRVLLTRGLSTICTGQTDHPQSWTVLALVAFALLLRLDSLLHLPRTNNKNCVGYSIDFALPSTPPFTPHSSVVSFFFSSSSLSFLMFALTQHCRRCPASQQRNRRSLGQIWSERVQKVEYFEALESSLRMV